MMGKTAVSAEHLVASARDDARRVADAVRPAAELVCRLLANSTNGRQPVVEVRAILVA